MDERTRVVVVHGPSTPELDVTLARAGLALLTKGGDTAVWGQKPAPVQPNLVPAVRSLLPRPALLTIPEAAAQLGVGRSTVYRLISNGDLDVVHVGRSVRIPTSAVDGLVERLVEGTGTPKRQQVAVDCERAAADPPIAAPATRTTS